MTLLPLVVTGIPRKLGYICYRLRERYSVCYVPVKDKIMEEKNEKNAYVKQVAEQKYEFGFTTDVHTEIIEKGLNEDVVRLISHKKGEPDWMLDFRLQAFQHWKTLKQPSWAHVHLPEIDYQTISYYADALAKKPVNKEIDPELEKTFDKLGIHLE